MRGQEAKSEEMQTRFRNLAWRVSRIWRDRLLGAAAGTILTIAGLWFALVTGATVCYIFQG